MCVGQQLLPIGRANLLENVRHVMTRRAVTNRQLVSDVLVRESLSYQSDNLPFPLGQGVGSDLLREGCSHVHSIRAVPFHGRIQRRFAHQAEARYAIAEYIEVFDNRQRLHQALGYRSPEEFER